MNDRPLKVGIAGWGVVGKRRQEYIDLHPHLKTVAVCDHTFKQSGTLDDGTLTFTNYKELLDVPLDILFVCLPNYMAADVTIAGLQKGLHVFCEKPPGRSVEDIERVMQVEQKYPHCKLKYGFNHRYHDSVKEALAIIQSGKFGEIINVRGVYGKSKIIPFSGGWRAERKYAGGGILLDQGIHMVDLMQLFCDEFVEVKSFISNSYWNHDVEDNAYAIMRDKRNRIAMIHSTATQWRHRFFLEITLQEGYLCLSGILSGSKSYGQEKLTIVRRSEDIIGSQSEEEINYLTDNSWRDEVNEFADSVIEDKPVVFGNSQEALATMKLIYRIYEADSIWKNDFLNEPIERLKRKI